MARLIKPAPEIEPVQDDKATVTVADLNVLLERLQQMYQQVAEAKVIEVWQCSQCGKIARFGHNQPPADDGWYGVYVETLTGDALTGIVHNCHGDGQRYVAGRLPNT